MKTPKYVIAPEGCCSWLTPGRLYEIIDWPYENLFTIVSDSEIRCFCQIYGCAHLNGGNWIVPSTAKVWLITLKQLACSAFTAFKQEPNQ